MMEIYSIGGGEIVYEVLKSVALCLNGGSGTLTAMLRIGGLCGVFIAYYIILYKNPLEVIRTWGLPVLMMVNLLFVPTTTVWVKDTITHYVYKIDRVPYGLALFASNTSKLGHALTGLVEQSFSLPDDLTYQKNGMLFGSDIMEKAKTFRITNQNFKENMRNFIGQCVKYDIMLNQKYSFDELRNTNDIWGLITSRPSKNRGIFWIPVDGKGRSQYVTCEGAVQKFNQIWNTELDRTFSVLGRKFFTGRFIGNSGSNSQKLYMSPQLENALKNEAKANLLNITSYLGDMAASAEETLKQALMINAIGDGASENSKAAGNAITYAETRALQQQNNTFDTIGKLAAKLLPIMKAVIEALAYACFIFVIPLCMVPNGYKFLMNWVAILIWLQAWPLIYAILNFIMNIAARASTLSEIGTAGGLTIANYVGVSDANAEIKLIAGYLTMSIPFICIAVVKGVSTFVHLASQLTGTSMQAASSAASEITSGNFSFGNVSMGNTSLDNMSQLQRNFSSSLSAGGHLLDTGGMQIRNDASGFSVVNQSVSSGVADLSAAQSDAEEFRKGYIDSVQKAEDAAVRLSNSESLSHSETARLAHSLSNMSAHDIAEKYSIGVDKAQQIAQDARVLDQYYTGHNYTDQTKAGANLSVGASIGAKLGKVRNTFNASEGTSAGTESGKAASAWAILNAGGGMNVGIESSNASNYGDSTQSSSSNSIAETERSFNSSIKDIASSNRNDEVAQLAHDHVDTLSKISQYSQEKAFSEHMAKNYQESYNQASSMTFSERRNLTDAAFEIATKERGYTMSEASRITRSQRSEDRAIAQNWFDTAKEREEIRRHPTMPAMKQPINWNDVSSTQNNLEQEFSTQKIQTQNKLDDFDKKIYAESVKSHVVSEQNTNKNISEKKQEIERKMAEIKKKEEKRSDTGAALSAGKYFLDTSSKK